MKVIRESYQVKVVKLFRAQSGEEEITAISNLNTRHDFIARTHNSIPPTVEASKNFFTLSVQIHFHSIILQCFCKFHFEGTNSLSMCIFAGTPCNNLYDSANLLIFFLLPSLNIIS